jgi:hypothetical protein
MSNKRGSVTIESSIAFTVVLVFIASMISVINIYRTDILMRRAQEQTCEKVSMICPLAITASDVISTTVNAFPDIEIDGISGSDAISQVAKFITGADMASGYTIEEMVLEGALGGYMANDEAIEYLRGNDRVWYDTSSALWAMAPERADGIISALGVGHMMFGTDYPLWPQRRDMQWLLSLELPGEDYEKIFWNTCAGLFGIQ